MDILRYQSFVPSYDTSPPSAMAGHHHPPLLGDLILNASNAVLAKVLANILAGENTKTKESRP